MCIYIYIQCVVFCLEAASPLFLIGSHCFLDGVLGFQRCSSFFPLCSSIFSMVFIVVPLFSWFFHDFH